MKSLFGDQEGANKIGSGEALVIKVPSNLSTLSSHIPYRSPHEGHY
jgi:hypothetical protein